MKGSEKMNLDKNEIEAIIETLRDIDIFLAETCTFDSLKVCKDGTTRITYLVNGQYVTVWRDANNYTYSVEIYLQKHSTLSGVISEPDVISAPCPFDRLPF